MHRIGDTIDERYELIRPLGTRHGAEMWEAEHRVVGRTVTLKILSAEVAADPVARKRLVAEAGIAADVGHPTVVEVYDVGVASDGVPYLVTEPIRGEILADIIAHQGALQPEDACEIALQLLAGLESAHASNIVHGDLQAESIVVRSGRGGQLLVKILDFGVALPLGETSGAPESTTRIAEADALDDLQAVGVLLYEMLSGRAGAVEAPRALETSNGADVVQARSLVPAIPAGLARIVDQALNPRAARRLGSAKEMAALLTPFATAERNRSLAPRNTLTPFLSPEARRTRGMARLERAVLGIAEPREKEKPSVRPNLVLLDRVPERTTDRPLRGAKIASSPPHLAPHELVEPRIPRAPRAPKHFMSHKPRHSGAERAPLRARARKYPSLPLRRWKAAHSSGTPKKTSSTAPGRSVIGLRLWSAGLVAAAGLSAGLLLARLLHF